MYSSGRHIVWIRDAQGRITWNPYGPVSSVTFGNGVSATFGVDTDYRINAVNVIPSMGPAIIGRSLSWTGDTLDLISDNVNSANSEAFGYSPTRRLTSASGPYGSYAWTYDPVGNRASETLNGTATTYNYPTTSNQLTSLAQGSTTVRALTYDGDGNVATDSKAGVTWTYAYDSEGRLSQAVAGANVVGTYTYDGLWRLARRVVTNTTPSFEVHYAQDQHGHIIVETDANGNTTREYIWLDDMPIAVLDGVNTPSPVTYYVHTDHLMRPIAMTDGSGNVVWRAVYDPFGAVQSITGAAVLDLRFPGQWFQLETGLHYNWHRHYDPTLGRYIQPDPLGVGQGSSLFGYASASPLVHTDRLGLCLEDLCVGETLLFCLEFPEICAGLGAGTVWAAEHLAQAMARRGGNQGGVCPPNNGKDECEEQRESDESKCSSVAKAFYGRRGEAICYGSAATRYGECLAAGGTHGIKTPLHGVDTPL